MSLENKTFEVKINKNTYTLQYPGKRESIKISERMTKGSEEVAVGELLDKIVVDPKLTIDSFDEESRFEDYDEVISKALKVVNGKFDKDGIFR